MFIVVLIIFHLILFSTVLCYGHSVTSHLLCCWYDTIIHNNVQLDFIFVISLDDIYFCWFSVGDDVTILLHPVMVPPLVYHNYISFVLIQIIIITTTTTTTAITITAELFILPNSKNEKKSVGTKHGAPIVSTNLTSRHKTIHLGRKEQISYKVGNRNTKIGMGYISISYTGLVTCCNLESKLRVLTKRV